MSYYSEIAHDDLKNWRDARKDAEMEYGMPDWMKEDGDGEPGGVTAEESIAWAELESTWTELGAAINAGDKEGAQRAATRASAIIRGLQHGL